MKPRLTIGKKLLGCFAIAALLGLGIGLFGRSSVAKLGKMQDELVTQDIKQLKLAEDVNAAAEGLRSSERGFILESYNHNESGAKENADTFRKTLGEITNALAGLQNLVDSNREKEAFNRSQSIVRQWTTVFEEIVRRCGSGDVAGAKKIENEQGQQLAKDLDKTTDDLVDGSLESVDAKDKETDKVRNFNQAAMLTGLGLLLAVVIAGVWVVRQVNADLRGVVGQLAEGASQIVSAAAQVASASQSLAQGSSEQAASLEETSASSEQINSMARKNSENATSAADLVGHAQQNFVQTNRLLEDMVVAMGDINTSSGKISKIIKVIDEIAFQTNLLALNAAVEAARAGEAGMGFAVVADEVRTLAQRSAQAAKDTASLIEESITKSNEGKTKVDQVAASVRAITEESAKVKILVEEVNLGSQEQTQGIEQVGKAIAQMEQVTQRAAASAEEGASAAEELNAQSETLKDIVRYMTVMVNGE